MFYAMKKVAFLLMTVVAFLGVWGCYDDSDLKSDIEDLNTKYGSLEIRIAALEETVQKNEREYRIVADIDDKFAEQGVCGSGGGDKGRVCDLFHGRDGSGHSQRERR